MTTPALDVALALYSGGGLPHMLWVRREVPTHHLAEARALPHARLHASDADAPRCSSGGSGGGEEVAALRGLFEQSGLLLAEGASDLPDDERGALRALYLKSPEAGHRRLAALGLRWATDRLTGGERLEARGDVMPLDMQIFRSEWRERQPPRPEDGAWVPIEEAMAGWSRGQELLTPALGRVMRQLAEGAKDEPPGAFLGWEVAPDLQMLPVRTPTLPPATHTNTFLIGSGEAILVEPASADEDELSRMVAWVEEAGHRGVEPLAIVATHHHPDHVGGATALSRRLGLPLWAHEGTAERLEGEVSFDRLLNDGETIELSGPREMSLSVLHTPGHAPGHLCLFEPRSGAMVAGDMVAGVGSIIVEPHDGDMTLYLASLRRMASLQPSMLLPAHGGVIADPLRCLEHYIEHRLMREAKVLAALRASGGAAEVQALLPHAYADTPEFLWPLAAMAAEAHLIKLERDGQARRVSGGWRAA